MVHTSRLPATDEIVRLSTLVPDYPVARRDLVTIARKWNLSNELVLFLRQFDAETVYMSRSDFILRCENLAKRIRAEWESPRQLRAF